MALTLTVNATGTADASDKATMRRRVNAENARRTALNVEAAAATPPQAQVALLPMATAGELKTSYEVCLSAAITAVHAKDVVATTKEAAESAQFQDLQPYWRDVPIDKRDQAKAAAIAAIQSVGT
jgi:hypothetical protein